MAEKVPPYDGIATLVAQVPATEFPASLAEWKASGGGRHAGALNRLPHFWFLVVLVCFVFCGRLYGWSQPHLAITKAALAVLPGWQRELLGESAVRLGEDYCLIPDHVFTDRANARFAAMEGRPKEVYLLTLHLPSTQEENLEVLRHFVGKAVGALAAKNMEDAARYMGTVCHQIEDYGSPSHTMPGDNQFTLLQQFLPPPAEMKDQLLHGPVESAELDVSIAGYAPRLLGLSVEEAAWRLLHRVHDAVINARSTTVPIIQALYVQDTKTVESNQLKAASVDATVVADALHTIIALGSGDAGRVDGSTLSKMPLSGLLPIEAANLYYPQTQFFSSPYWGHPRSGSILAEGKRSTQLKLKVEENGTVVERVFSNGISAGMGRALTFPLPKGVFSRFTVLAGLHSELGTEGKVEFTVQGDGKVLANAVVSGSDPALPLECDLAGVAQLQLVLKNAGGDGKKSYAVWAEPLLLKE